MEKYFLLIYKELKGTIDTEEAIMLKEWVESSEDHLEIKEDLVSSYALMENISDPFPIDVDADFKKLQIKLDQRNTTSEKETVTPRITPNVNKPKPATGKSSFLFRNWMVIAASLIVLLAATFTFNNLSGNTEPEWLSISSNGTDNLLIELVDGSQVWLNKNSELKYTEQFNGTHRNVMLEGEAFFNIEHNSEQPFMVSTPNAEMTVLGTSFNVNTRDNRQTKLSVKTGRVLFTDRDQTQQIILQAGRAASLDHPSGKIAKATSDISNDYLWHTDMMGFKKAKLSDVFTTIEDYFNIKIINHNKNIDDCVFSMTYQEPDLDIIMGNLKKIYHLSIDKRSSTLYHLSDGICK